MFVITMYRNVWQEKVPPLNTHSYVLGVYYTINQAKFAANVEMLSRAGKYAAHCTYHVPNGLWEPYSQDIEDECGWLEYEWSEEVEAEMRRLYPDEVNDF